MGGLLQPATFALHPVEDAYKARCPFYCSHRSRVLGMCRTRTRRAASFALNLVAYEDSESHAVLTQLLVKKGEGWHNMTIRISALTTLENSDPITSFEKCMKVPNEFAEAAINFRRVSRVSYGLQDRFASDVR